MKQCEICTCIEDFALVKNNKVIGLPTDMQNSRVEFAGENNIIFFDENVNLEGTTVRFFGDNNVVFLSTGGKHKVRAKVDIYNNSVFYMGKNCNTTRPIHAVLSEGKHIIIGDDCLFSFGIWFRNADPHLIYDGSSKKRINMSKSVFVGDHIWIGQDAFVSKGTKIGSGAIIGAKCVTGGKTLNSNCSYAGVPGKAVRENVFWLKPSVHSYNQEQTKSSMEYNDDKYLYFKDGNQLRFDIIDKEIDSLKTCYERFDYLKKTIFENNNKNRFFVQNEKAKSSLISRIFRD